MILSLVLAPMRQGDPAFRGLVETLLADLDTQRGRGAAGAGRRARRRLATAGTRARSARVARSGREPSRWPGCASPRQTLLAFVVMRLGIRVGEFDPAVYRRDVVANSDFRKFDDNLRMTLDCTPDLADEIERRLAQARHDDVARFGLHRQSAALMTCIVPSIAESNHFHFVDGAAGGYALAARQLKDDSATGDDESQPVDSAAQGSRASAAIRAAPGDRCRPAGPGPSASIWRGRWSMRQSVPTQLPSGRISGWPA